MWTMQPRSSADAKDTSLKRWPKGRGFLPTKLRFVTRAKGPRTKNLNWVVIAASVAVVTISALWSHVSAAQANTRTLAFVYAKLSNNSLLAVTGQTIVFESSSADHVARVELNE